MTNLIDIEYYNVFRQTESNIDHVISDNQWLVLVTKTNHKEDNKVSRMVWTPRNYNLYCKDLNLFGDKVVKLPYTKAGRVPTEIHSKDKQNNMWDYTYKFEFIDFKELWDKGGHRERDVLSNCETWDTVDVPKPFKAIELQHTDGEHVIQYDLYQRKYIG